MKLLNIFRRKKKVDENEMFNHYERICKIISTTYTEIQFDAIEEMIERFDKRFQNEVLTAYLDGLSTGRHFALKDEKIVIVKTKQQ